MPLAIPLQEYQEENERQSKTVTIRLVCCYGVTFDKTSQGPPERLLTRKYERRPPPDEPENNSDNVIDFLKFKTKGKDK